MKECIGETRYADLPESGMGKEELLALLEKWAGKDEAHWASGRISGSVYHGGKDLMDISAAGMRDYILPFVLQLLIVRERVCPCACSFSLVRRCEPAAPGHVPHGPQDGS